jgi:hypothetical protein
MTSIRKELVHDAYRKAYALVDYNIQDTVKPVLLVFIMINNVQRVSRRILVTKNYTNKSNQT